MDKRIKTKWFISFRTKIITTCPIMTTASGYTRSVDAYSAKPLKKLVKD